MRIKQLYQGGKKFVIWPLRVTYRPIPSAQPPTAPLERPVVLIWAPKSLFRHAVDRNRLRRQMREAYRLQQHLYTGQPLQIAFNYIDPHLQPYAVIERAIKKALIRLNQCAN